MQQQIATVAPWAKHRASAGNRRRLLLGLIGSHIQASRTPAMHEREAARHGLTCLYQLIDLDLPGRGPEALPHLLDSAERLGFAGLNITHPCKQKVMPLLSSVAEDAQALGAVNTVVFRDGERRGYNTDLPGFTYGFRRELPDAPLKNVVQLGAGGAGSATAYAMLKMDAGRVTLIDSEPEKAEALAGRLTQIFGEGRVAASNQLAASLENADGLIHATPTGAIGRPGMPLPESLLRPNLWVAEIVYFPLETELLTAARRLGCRTVDGGGMAVGQAVEAFRLFTGLEPDAERMRADFDSLSEASNPIT